MLGLYFSQYCTFSQVGEEIEKVACLLGHLVPVDKG